MGGTAVRSGPDRDLKLSAQGLAVDPANPALPHQLLIPKQLLCSWDGEAYDDVGLLDYSEKLENMDCHALDG